MYDILRRWVEEGPAGLEDKSSAPHDHARKVDLRAITEVSRLQKNPYIGAFRIHAALEELGIHLSRATCGRIMVMNRRLPDYAPRRKHVLDGERTPLFEYDLGYEARNG